VTGIKNVKTFLHLCLIPPTSLGIGYDFYTKYTLRPLADSCSQWFEKSRIRAWFHSHEPHHSRCGTPYETPAC